MTRGFARGRCRKGWENTIEIRSCFLYPVALFEPMGREVEHLVVEQSRGDGGKECGSTSLLLRPKWQGPGTPGDAGGAELRSGGFDAARAAARNLAPAPLQVLSADPAVTCASMDACSCSQYALWDAPKRARRGSGG